MPFVIEKAIGKVFVQSCKIRTKNSTTNVAHVEDDGSEFSLIGSSLVRYFDEWILDSGSLIICVSKRD